MLEKLFFISDVVQVPLNLIAFIALLASIVTFFAFLRNLYAKGLRDILLPCGCTFRPRLRILFLCRRSPLKKRIFIEYALLKTQGHTIVPSQWNLIINDFKLFYNESASKHVYTIPNCTALIGEAFAAGIQRYFDFFCNPRALKTFGADSRDLSWVITIHVAEAYATPTCLLMGLLSKYEENWSEFVKKYVSSAFLSPSIPSGESPVLTNELYDTFAWLLWGPSYELNYEHYWDGICQISFGDESNSFAAIANRNFPMNRQLQLLFQKSTAFRYGALLSIDISLHEKNAYFRSIWDTINPKNEYFVQKIEESQAFAAEITAFSPYENYKSNKYYCTAYVWLLFELENEEGFAFRPETSVAFFEHTNLADKETYSFLTETLIDKCFKHFSTIFSDPVYSSRRYRLVCAMNSMIHARFVERYRHLLSQGDRIAEQFASRLLVEPRRSPPTVFAEFDSFFTSADTISFMEVSLSDKASFSAFSQFYSDVYLECFPNADERETYDSLIQYLRNAMTDIRYRYHIVLVENRGRIIGGGIFDYFKASNCGMLEYVAIQPEFQSSGVGTQLYRHILSVLEEDAFRNQHKLACVFCEVESSDYLGATGNSSKVKCIPFWRKQGFSKLDFHYIQPALSANQKSVEILNLIACNLTGKNSFLPKELVLLVIKEYMLYCMRIDHPEAHPVYREMAKSLEGQEEIRLLPLTLEP